MKEQQQKSRRKTIYIILLSFIILVVLLLKTNKIIQERKINLIKLKQSKNDNKLLFGRLLDFKNDIKKICNSADKDLQKYYVTGNEDLLDFFKNNKSSTNTSKPIQAIVDILEDNGELKENILNYLKHLIPILIFLAIGVLAIPGWIVCCGLCCGDCCCCSCCKNPSCKLPCFPIVTVCYLISLISYIYSLTQTNSIFVGLSNTECAVMKFIEEIDIGESKETIEMNPKWIGFDGISDLFGIIKTKVKEMKQDTLKNLQNKNTEEDNIKNNFINQLKIVCDDVNSKSYFITNDNYRLDSIENFGLSDLQEKTTFSYKLKEECAALSKNSRELMDNVYNNFTNVLKDDNITLILDDANREIDKIKEHINDIKNLVAEKITKYGEYIDDYGKLAFLIIFGVVCLFILLTALLVSLLFGYERELCNKKNCGHNCFRFFTHFSWNLLAFLMIITFIVGFFFTFVGAVGKDAATTIKYIISEENLKNIKPIFTGNASNYLDVCINGNGQIVDELGITNNKATSSIGDLNIILGDLASAINKLKNTECNSINNYKNTIESEINFSKTDIKLCKVGSYCKPEGNTININDLCSKLNEKITSLKEKWSINCPKDNNYYVCNNTVSSPPIDNQNGRIICFQPKDCYDNSYSIHERYESQSEVQTTAKTIDFIVKSTQILNKKGDVSNNDNYIAKIIDDLQNRYKYYIGQEEDILKFYINTTRNLTGIFDDYIGNETSPFSFLNCKFIEKNIFILLHYLDQALGNHIHVVGIYLLLAGCSMIFAISGTIIELIIIDDGRGDNTQAGTTQKFDKIQENKVENYKKIVNEYLKNDQFIALPSPADYINKLEMNSNNIVLGFKKTETRDNNVMLSSENVQRDKLANDDATI